MKDTVISFGDTVRVHLTKATEDVGVAGLVGKVYGETKPSVTEIEVIGDNGNDYAICVHFEETSKEIWIVPELLDFVDHGEGTEITLDGIDKKWVRNEDGGWTEYLGRGESGKDKP